MFVFNQMELRFARRQHYGCTMYVPRKDEIGPTGTPVD
jgi:hypothetical protein